MGKRLLLDTVGMVTRSVELVPREATAKHTKYHSKRMKLTALQNGWLTVLLPDETSGLKNTAAEADV